jgi:hypothetical protein
MNAKDLVLGIFVVATVVFAALTVNEYTQGQAPSNSTVVSTITLISTSTIVIYTTGSISTSSLATTQTFVTGTSVATSSDTYLIQCSITGIGGFQLRVVSDSTGAPVSGETINAVDRLGCNVGQTSQIQVVYLNNFSQGQGGWLTPVFPSQATPGGRLNFTVSYQGGTYDFSALVPPVGTTCVTLHVPSGSLNTTTTMSGLCT